MYLTSELYSKNTFKKLCRIYSASQVGTELWKFNQNF